MVDNTQHIMVRLFAVIPKPEALDDPDITDDLAQIEVLEGLGEALMQHPYIFDLLMIEEWEALDG